MLLRLSVGTGIGESATVGGVRVKDPGLPADGIGVEVAVTRNVVGGGSAGENGVLLFPPILFPATSVPITHIRLPATSAPIVRIASRDNERSRLM